MMLTAVLQVLTMKNPLLLSHTYLQERKFNSIRLLPVLFVLMVLSCSANGQSTKRDASFTDFKFGPVLGYDRIKINTDLDISSGGTDLTETSLNVFRYGVSLEKRFATPIAVAADITYRAYDFSTELFLFSGFERDAFRRWEYDRESILFCPSARYYFARKGVNFFGSLGVLTEINLQSNQRRYIELGSDVTELELDRPMVTNEIGFSADVGVEFKSVMLRIQYTAYELSSFEEIYRGNFITALVAYLF